MKTRINVIVAAAARFIENKPRTLPAPTALDNILPETAKAMKDIVPFEQKTLVPRGLLKCFSAEVIERILGGKLSVNEAMVFLTATERDYVLNVLDEIYAWAEAQGFQLPDDTQPGGVDK